MKKNKKIMEKQRPIRTPKQERSRETTRKIIKAGEKLFSEVGFYKTNTKEIAREAGVSVGAFYAYFNDKKSLFIEVFKEYNRRVMERVFEPSSFLDKAGDNPRDLVHAMIQKALKAHDLSPQFHRELMAMRYTDPDVHALLETADEVVLARFREILQTMSHSIRVRDREAGALVLKSSIEEVIHGIKIFKAPIEEERLLKELADMITLYLFGYQEPKQTAPHSNIDTPRPPD